jgi:hypothetical protein
MWVVDLAELEALVDHPDEYEIIYCPELDLCELNSY